MTLSPEDRIIPIQLTTQTQYPEVVQGLQIGLDLGLIQDVSIQLQTTTAKIPWKGSRRSQAEPAPPELKLKTQISVSSLLAGLQPWQELGLLENAHVEVQLEVLASHPQLLAGLDHWLKLELISENQVKQLCEQYLTMLVPAPKPESSEWAEDEPAPAPTPAPRRYRTPQRQRRHVISQVIQSLVAELSVIWLLLLGVFMVVISSGVIAATQWQHFPPALQYGILLVYTLIFGVASLWMKTQPNLRLTAQALEVITLLLVPVNFFAIDGFRLWQTPLDWIVSGFAIFSLTAMTVYLFRDQTGKVSPRHQGLLLNHLGLSYLHLGWNLWGWELIAVYLATIGTAILTVSQQRRRSRISVANNPPPALPQVTQFPISLNAALIIYALIILLTRAIWIADVEVIQLGLALGICGALIAVITPTPAQTHEAKLPGEFIGGLLLGVGWLVSVESIPWQALGVSGLGLWFCWRRMQRLNSPLDFIAFFLIGLQMHPLSGRLFPTSLKESVVQFGIEYSSTDTGWSLSSLAWFPYLIFLVGLSEYFTAKNQLKLAKIGGWIALCFGVFLSVISLPSPAFRTLNVAGSTLILAYLTQKRQVSASTNYPGCVYLTHICGSITTLFAIHWFFPNLSFLTWVMISLTLMIAEWSVLMLGNTLAPIWRQSCWYLGAGFALLSYGLLFANWVTIFLGNQELIPWQFSGLIIPGMLAGMALIRPTDQSVTGIIPPRVFLSSLSVIGLIFTQSLIVPFPQWRWIGLAVTLGLMLFNTHVIRHLVPALITVGSGLVIVLDIFLEQRWGVPAIYNVQWLLVTTVITAILWLCRHQLVLKSQNPASSPLNQLYAVATDYWAMAIGAGTVVVFNVLALEASEGIREFPPTLILLISSILMITMVYRTWQPPRQEELIGFSFLVISILQVPTLHLPTFRVINLAIATTLFYVQTQRLQKLWAATLMLGFGIGFLIASLWRWVPALSSPSNSGAGWLLVGALSVAALWSLEFGLHSRSTKLAQIYAQGADFWGFLISGLTLIAATLHSLLVYWGVFPATSTSILAIVIILATFIGRYWHRPSGRLLYSMGWALELLLIEGLSLTHRSLLALSVANIIVGVITQLAGDFWFQRHQRSENQPQVSLTQSWNVIPLLYGALGAALRGGSFTSWTGISTLGLVLIAVGVGRRSPQFKPLIYLGMVGVAASGYEMLSYQIADFPVGNQLVAMAALATSFLYGYRLLSPWLTHYLSLSVAALRFVTHVHWGLGSFLLATATFYPISLNSWIGLTTGILLTRYAIWEGRRLELPTVAELWVYLGVLEGVGMVVYGFNLLPAPLLTLLLPWSGTLAALLAYFLYILPWEVWGWPGRPWHVSAVILPLLAILATSHQVSELSLLMVAGFYAFLAYLRRQIRLTYLSVALVNWAICQWGLQEERLTLMGVAFLMGISILYIAQVDPALKAPTARETRHWVRCLGTVMICGGALIFHPQTGILAGIFSLLAVFLGLALRVRAFLYIGTLIFSMNAFYQLVILISTYPLLKWMIGLMVGLGFIGIAATFERSREQMTTWLRNWVIQLEDWQ